MDHPTEGQQIQVLCQPKSQKAKLIDDEWKHASGACKDAKQEEDDRFDSAKEGAPGSPDAAVGSTSDQLSALGERLERGELTESEFDLAVQRIMDPRR